MLRPSEPAPALAGAAAPKRILFLAHRVPYPPDKGDRIRSYNVLAHLAEAGTVDLAFLTDEPVGAATRDALSRLCRRVEAVPLSRQGRWCRAARSLLCGRSLTEGLFEAPELRRVVDSWVTETSYDSVVCFSSGVLPYVLGRGLEPRLVVDLVDVDSQKFLDYADRAVGPKALLFRIEGNRVRSLERAAGRARAVVLVSEAEAALFRRFAEDAQVQAIPNGVDLEYFRPRADASEAATCVFVGQLDYRANVLGLQWFCREVWPAIHEVLPDATFEIVGRNPVQSVRRLSAVPGVQVIGPVADVRPHVAAARVVVVPLPVARGIQNKVLEALAMARPVIASPQALEGLNVMPGRDALAAETPDEWTRAVVGLWGDPTLRGDLGRAGRAFVEKNHHWGTCLERFRMHIGSDSVGRIT